MQKILIIQTAFIGDVILATAVVEKLHQYYPHSQIDFVLRKGNEGLLENHPFVKNVIIWDKKNNKLKNLFALSRQIKSSKYDVVVNLHRFVSSGIIAVYSGAKQIIGFDKNPLSFLYTKRIKHIIGTNKHEVERNQELIESLTDGNFSKPKLYPAIENIDSVKKYKDSPYICIAPASVWPTKEYPKEKWVELCDRISGYTIYLLGASGDSETCNWILERTINTKVVNLAGKLNFLESAALMAGATMNYVNDSAPLHIASATNAKTTAIFCSTVPAFGFGPLADESRIVEVKDDLNCRPCGTHGHKTCPKGHFKCGFLIETNQLLAVLSAYKN